jgi:hypothetical protein
LTKVRCKFLLTDTAKLRVETFLLGFSFLYS